MVLPLELPTARNITLLELHSNSLKYYSYISVQDFWSQKIRKLDKKRSVNWSAKGKRKLGEMRVVGMLVLHVLLISEAQSVGFSNMDEFSNPRTERNTPK